MSDVVKRRSECVVVGQTGRECDSVEIGRDREAVGRPGEMRVRLQTELGWGEHVS